MYNYANLDFIKFEGEPSFNKNGSLFIYAENKDTFVYEVTEDSLQHFGRFVKSFFQLLPAKTGISQHYHNCSWW